MFENHCVHYFALIQITSEEQEMFEEELRNQLRGVHAYALTIFRTDDLYARSGDLVRGDRYCASRWIFFVLEKGSMP